MYDLLVKNGRIHDGTGSASYAADIGVVGDEIAAIGRLEGEAVRTIDAAGLAVAPGFIDLHSHSDASFLMDPTAQSKVRQGVTLELVGNCGYSFCAPLHGAGRDELQTWVGHYTDSFDVTWKDFSGYLDTVQQVGPPVNLAVQVGHATVRACVIGLDDRAPRGDELDRMKDLVAECLDAGAMGLSTGLHYAPASYARTEEIIDLAQVAADRGKLYSTHMRAEGSRSVGIFSALNEAIEIGRRTGIRVEISHLKCVGPATWGRASDVMDLLERARGEGIDIAGDQYPYAASSTSLTGALFPRWSLDGGRQATLGHMANSDMRQRLSGEIDARYPDFGGPEAVVIARFVPEPRYEGMNMVQVAEDMGCGLGEAALRLYEREEASIINHMMSDEDVDTFASHPLVSVGSDGDSLSVDGLLSVGKPHPRSYGTNPRFLSRFVRERGVVSLEEAIRKMTALPASRLGLTRRGRIGPGFAADLVAFSPDEVADTATYAEPHSYPVGIPHVVVNGDVVIEDGEFTGAGPGRVLRDFGD